MSSFRLARKRSLLYLNILGGFAMAAGIGDANRSVCNAEQPQSLRTYRAARDFLAQHTSLVELSNNEGARVAICPAWQGRVMTSTCGGVDGPSFGFVNREFIEAGRQNAHFNNFGAEDRMWLSPEGGRFSLWFKPGAKQTLDNWFTPPALNEGAYELAPGADASHCRFTRRMKFQNTAGAEFDLLATREVRLLDQADLVKAFGAAATKTTGRKGVTMVAYETVNTITNQGPAMTKEKGLVSIWILSMLNASTKAVIILPYQNGGPQQLGPGVNRDYFGDVPPQRLKTLPEAILFSADANYRSKIGTSQRRAKNILGSIDFEGNVLTLANFTMPDDPTKVDYMNNAWDFNADPYVGDVANAYNDGPPAPGKKGLGNFYEIESLSPAVALKTGESLTHHHRTIHIRADQDSLSEMAKQTLGVDLQQVRKEMAVP